MYSITGCSSESALYPSSNLIDSNNPAVDCPSPQPWITADRDGTLEIQFDSPTQIRSLDLGNAGAGLVKVEVKKKASEKWKLLLVSHLRRIAECKSRTNRDSKLFLRSDKFGGERATSDDTAVYARVSLQGYVADEPLGLWYLRFNADHPLLPADAHLPASVWPRLTTSSREAGAAARASSTTSAASIPAQATADRVEDAVNGTSTSKAAAAAAASSSSSSSPKATSPKRNSRQEAKREELKKQEEDRKAKEIEAAQRAKAKADDAEADGEPADREQQEEVVDATAGFRSSSPPPSPSRPPRSAAVAAAAAASSSSSSSASSKPPPPKPKGAPRVSPSPASEAAPSSSPSSSPLSDILKDVVFVVSGYVNPHRSEIRERALKMGARFEPVWTKRCTHLIAAFENTPKASEAQQQGGYVLTRDWLDECWRLKKRVRETPFTFEHQQRLAALAAVDAEAGMEHDDSGDAEHVESGQEDDDAPPPPPKKKKAAAKKKKKKKGDSDDDSDDDGRPNEYVYDSFLAEDDDYMELLEKQRATRRKASARRAPRDGSGSDDSGDDDEYNDSLERKRTADADKDGDEEASVEELLAEAKNWISTDQRWTRNVKRKRVEERERMAQLEADEEAEKEAKKAAAAARRKAKAAAKAAAAAASSSSSSSGGGGSGGGVATEGSAPAPMKKSAGGRKPSKQAKEAQEAREQMKAFADMAASRKRAPPTAPPADGDEKDEKDAR